MNLEKINENINGAIKLIEEIEIGNADVSEVTSLSWQCVQCLGAARALADSTSVRAGGQLLVRRLIIEELDRLVSRCQRAVGVTTGNNQ